MRWNPNHGFPRWFFPLIAIAVIMSVVNAALFYSLDIGVLAALSGAAAIALALCAVVLNRLGTRASRGEE